jgi:glycosyltransferase involved in cell wall biosynthesis
MKILLISSGFGIYDLHSGGVNTYLRALADSLSSMNHQVTVMDTVSSNLPFHTAYQVISFRNILPSFYKEPQLINPDVAKIGRYLKNNRFDVVHVNMMIDLPPTLLLEIKKHSKLIVTLHDYSMMCKRILLIDRNNVSCQGPEGGKKCNQCIGRNEYVKSSVLRKFYKLARININHSTGHEKQFEVVKNALLKADCLIAVSNRVKSIFESSSITNSVFLVNHIGNITADPSYRKAFENKRRKQVGDPLILGFIGNFTRHKGADIFLQLASICKSRKFEIFGLISDEYLSKIGDYPNIAYNGKYNQNDLVKILSAIDIGLVLPIWEDTAPQVVFEFVNASIPVIATRMGGIPDFINKTNGKLFDNTSEGLYNVQNFINSDALYSLLEKSFPQTKTIEQHAKEVLAIYKSVLS